MKSNHSFSFLKWHQNDYFRLFTIYIDKQRYNEQSSDFKSLSRLVNFVPESSFPFALISSIYPEKRPRKAETGIKDGLEEIEHIFPFGKFRLGKQAYLSRRTVASWNFPPKRPEKVVFHLLSNWISQKLFVNGKQPQFPSAINSNVMIRLFRMCGVPWSPLITWIIIFSELYH